MNAALQPPCEDLPLPPEKNDQVDRKENHNNDFQPKHPPFVDFGMNDTIELIHLSETLLDAGTPLIEVKTIAGSEVNAGQIPIPKEFGDVSHFIGQFGDIDPETAQVVQGL